MDLLRQGVRGPLTLVSAPAGYGKSVLVASWTASLEPTVAIAHTVMREADRAPAVFWDSAIDVLGRAGVDVSRVRASATLEGVDETMLDGLIGSINAHEGAVVWVLDCAEVTLSPKLADNLHRMIQGCPLGLRLVLLTRADPPLPLHRYRLAGSITEIRAADLVFTATEASILFQRVGLDLTPVEALMLRTRTGGWPAGLKFAAIALAGRVDTAQAIQQFRGDSGNVAAYLMSEVFAKQPPQIQEFLLRTCLVDELSPGLASALTGRRCEASALQFVAQGNTFLEPVPGRPGCYRFQSLFREFLRSQLSYEHPELKGMAHRAAAEWLVDHGQPLAAMQHAAEAGAWPMATRFLVEGAWFGNVFLGGHSSLLRDLFKRMPLELEGAEPAVTRAALALAVRDEATCVAELAVARQSPVPGASTRSRACELAIAVLRAVCECGEDDLEARLDRVLAAESALRGAGPEVGNLHPELSAVVARSKATVLLEQGALSPALEALDEGIRAAEAAHLGEAALEELRATAALVHALKGELRQSERILTGLVPGGGNDTTSSRSVSRTALVALAWVRSEGYNLEEARALVRRAEEAEPLDNTRALHRVLARLRSRLFVADGAWDLARAALRAGASRSNGRERRGWLGRALLLDEATVLLKEGRPEEAAEVAREAEGSDQLPVGLVLRRALQAGGHDVHALANPNERALEQAPLEIQVDTWLALAEQSLRDGDGGHAEAYVDRALRLASPEGLRRPFLEAGAAVRVVLEKRSLSSRTRWLHTSRVPYVEQPPRSRSGEQHQSPPRATGSQSTEGDNLLTLKEQEVLVHLAELLTTEEIAESMFVSVNTVRSHVRNILRKLGVTRRNEAVRRAWDLDLLPRPDVALKGT